MSRGTVRENYVKDWLEERGWWVCRAAGSLGDADLVALKPRWNHPASGGWDPEVDGVEVKSGKLLVEVKSTKAGPFATFGPKDRVDLLRAGDVAGANVVLCWTPPSQGKKIQLHWIWPEDWPKPRA